MPGLMEEFQKLLAEMPNFQAALEEGMARGTPAEQRALAELSQTVTEHLQLAREWIPKVNAAFEKEIAAAQASIDQTTAHLAELEKEFADQVERAKNPPPKRPRPPAPGVGDPSHGRHVADELLALIGFDGQSEPAPTASAGDVWEMTSKQWMVDVSNALPVPPPAPKPVAETKPPPRPAAPKKENAEDVWDMKSSQWKTDDDETEP